MAALGKEYQLAKQSGQTEGFFMTLETAFRSGQLRPAEFSLRDMFMHLIPNGRELMESWRSVNGGYSVEVLEATGAVDTAAFSRISGQLLITKVLEVWNNPALLWRDLVEVIPTNLNGEKLVGIAPAADEIDTIPENTDYGLTGLQEIWVQTPQLVKKGTGIAVTKEAILHDNTNMIYRRAATIADAMALNLEKRILDMVFGITNSYNRMGSTSNTYLTSGAYVNVATSNALRDYTNIDAALQLFEDMVDPDTGEPIVVGADTIITPTALSMTARRILTATLVRVASGAGFIGDQLKNPDILTDSAQPLQQNFTLKTSPYVKARTSSTSTWFIGQPKQAFALMEGWPVQVVQAPANSEADFNRDVVARWKVSHYGTPAVKEPRRMVKCTA